METGDEAARARQRETVRRGYDAISLAYRSDDGEASSSLAEDVRRYAGWVAELASLLPAAARVVDLGCGVGFFGRAVKPSTRWEMASAAVSQGGTGRATIGPRTAGPSGPGGGEGRRRSDTLLRRVQDRPRTVFA